VITTAEAAALSSYGTAAKITAVAAG